MPGQHIRSYIKDHLIDPLKQYPTVIQDTIIEIIIQKLTELYNYTYKFPEIVSPDRSRLDIIKLIADQFLFKIREDADLQEQINILNNILYVYNKRGSVDTIENMWKYYGGELPRDVEVVIPSYNLFRYSVSALSGTHQFVKGKASSVILDTAAPTSVSAGIPVIEIGSTRYRATTGISQGSNIVYLTTVDGLSIGGRLNIGDIYEGTILEISENTDISVNRSGVYEIKLINNTYPILDLKEFLLKELVAAGNYIYFTNSLHMDVSSSTDYSNPYNYLVYRDDFIQIQMAALIQNEGFTWSGRNTLSSNNGVSPTYWSGDPSIYLELIKMVDLPEIAINTYTPYEALGFFIDRIPTISEIVYRTKVNKSYTYILNSMLYCTPNDESMTITRYSYNSDGEIVDTQYNGYFILGKSLLGERS